MYRELFSVIPVDASDDLCQEDLEAMTTLTLDQRARRRATRKSNRVRATYPLLAHAGVIDDWLTTPEQALAQIESIDHAAQQLQQEMAASRAQKQRESDEYRARVASQVDAATMALLDKHVTIYPSDPVYTTEFWQQVLDGRFDIHAYTANLERIRERGEQARGETTSAV